LTKGEFKRLTESRRRKRAGGQNQMAKPNGKTKCSQFDSENT